MLREDLQAWLRQQPFRPFRINLEDGRTFDVRYPGMTLLGRAYVDIGIPEVGVPDPFVDHVVMVPLAAVRSVEPLETANPSTPS
jgi:hypothetical protein